MLYCIFIIIAVNRDLGLHGFFRRNTLFSRLVRQAKGTEDLVQSGLQGTLPTMTVNNLFENYVSHYPLIKKQGSGVQWNKGNGNIFRITTIVTIVNAIFGLKLGCTFSMTEKGYKNLEYPCLHSSKFNILTNGLKRLLMSSTNTDILLNA